MGADSKNGGDRFRSSSHLNNGQLLGQQLRQRRSLYWTSLIKIFALLLFIFAAIAMRCGAGPIGHRVDGSTWREYPVFKNGFKGIIGNMFLAFWAMGDMVFSVIMSGEAQELRFSMARAAKLIAFRCIFIYGLCIMFVTFLVPSNDPRLQGRTSNVGTSPFVISLVIAGIQGLPDFLNAIMVIGVAAIAGESIYVASRVMRSMAVQKLIPESGTIGFTWLVSITSSSFFIVWILVSITCFCLHAAIKAQGSKIFEESWAFRCIWYPFTPMFLLGMSLFLMASCLYVGLSPIGINKASAYYFFQYNLGLCIVLVFSVAYKLVYRTPQRQQDV
ncbi:uncharacterized protein PAC_18056 [Phialocephala subalpina]|uniref:Amino acid permease/ SLC12A domain-containing protein n=1 Tax=Phialocephala subalpina TaxID=576137 RepID=A0A1L7XT55_9HELO|nr:uncharacterized protein PAC_18056 [Phialocephala subalpina]